MTALLEVTPLIESLTALLEYLDLLQFSVQSFHAFSLRHCCHGSYTLGIELCHSWGHEAYIKALLEAATTTHKPLVLCFCCSEFGYLVLGHSKTRKHIF